MDFFIKKNCRPIKLKVLLQRQLFDSKTVES